MYVIVAALVVGVLTAVPVCLVALWGSPHRPRTLTLGGVAIIGLTVAYSIVFSFGDSGVGLTLDVLYGSYWLWFAGIASVVVVFAFDALAGHDGRHGMWKTDRHNSRLSTGGRALVAISALVLGFGLAVEQGGVFTADRAKHLARLLNVQELDASMLPEVDPQYVVTVPPEVVSFKAKSAVKGYAATRYVVDDGHRLCMINGKLYWISQVITNTKLPNGDTRGYVATDAQNPSADAVYHDAGYDKWHDVQQLLRNKYRGQIVSNLHFEVDDSWGPWYVATLSARPLSFRMGVTFPRKVVLVNPSTGEISDYKFREMPAWIDHVWSGAEARVALGYWGRWGKSSYGFWHESLAGRYQVVGDVHAVATPNGVAWQLLMTPAIREHDKDAPISYVVHVNARTGETRAYREPELPAVAQVAATIHEAPANGDHLAATYLCLYSRNGGPVWVASLVWNNNRFGAATASNFGGLAMTPADKPMNTSVVIRNDGDIGALTKVGQH